MPLALLINFFRHDTATICDLPSQNESQCPMYEILVLNSFW